MVTARAAHTFDVVTHLLAREFRLRYRRSVLGVTWAIAQPVARLAVFSFIFTNVLPLEIPNYPVFLFTGLLAWGWFSSGVASATSSALSRRELLFRPGLSRTVVPVVSVLTDLLDYLVALPVLLVVLVLTTGLTVTSLFLPVLLVVQGLLILGLGFMLCSANVYVRDVNLVVGLGLLLGFYVTPVFYRPGSVPDSARWLVDLNPMAHLIEAQRDILVVGDLPSFTNFALVTLVAVALFLAGWAVYVRASATFVDEL